MTARLLNRTIQIALDVTVLSIAYWLAFLFRFEFNIPHQWMRVLLTTWPYVVLIHYIGLSLFGVPRMSWRYVSIGDIGPVLFGMAASTSLLVAVRAIGPALTESFMVVLIPFGVLAMDLIMAFLGLVG